MYRTGASDNELLLLHRASADGAYWHAVAGACEDDETNTAAAVREVREETGFDATGTLFALDHRHRHTADSVPLEFRALWPEDTESIDVESFATPVPLDWVPRLNDEHDTYCWRGADGAIALFRWPEAKDALMILARVWDGTTRPRGGRTMSEQVAAVRRLFDAVRRRDQAALLEAYHPEVLIREAPSLPYGGEFHGHKGAIQHVQGYYRTWEGLKPPELFEELNRTRPDLFVFLEAGPHHVVTFGRQIAVAPNGSSLDIPETFVFKMQDNRVIESWMFNQDTVAVLEFLRKARS